MRIRYFTPLEGLRHAPPPVGLILHVTGALNHIYMHAEHQLRSSISLKDRAFLSRVSTLTSDIDIANLSVCTSVCYVPVSDENGLTYRHSFFHRTVSQSF